MSFISKTDIVVESVFPAQPFFLHYTNFNRLAKGRISGFSLYKSKPLNRFVSFKWLQAKYAAWMSVKPSSGHAAGSYRRRWFGVFSRSVHQNGFVVNFYSFLSRQSVINVISILQTVENDRRWQFFTATLQGLAAVVQPYTQFDVASNFLSLV